MHSFTKVSFFLTLLWQYSHQSFDRPRLTFASFWGKKIKNVTRPGFEPMISRSKVNCSNHYSIGYTVYLWSSLKGKSKLISYATKETFIRTRNSMVLTTS